MTTSRPGTRSAEAKAKQALLELSKYTTPPPALDLLPILSLLPHKPWSSPPNPNGYIVFGLSPSVTPPLKHLPYVTQLLTSFVTSHFPELPFCSITVRVGGKLQAHRDTAVTGLSAVFSGSGQSPCGLWISDSAGNDFEDEFVPGFEVDLSTGPIQFDAKVPHCGRTSFKAGSYATRVSIAAFQLRRRTPPCMTTCDTLGSLGFSIPEASALVPQTLEQQEPPKADQP